jgi:hypothetical protein
VAGLQISIESAVLSVESEYTEGIGNGRRRARLCRQLKHVDLSDAQKERCVTAILQRLETGHFSQNFKDELGLAVHLHPDRVHNIAISLMAHSKQYIARYATWLVNKIQVRQSCSVPRPRDISEVSARQRYVDPAFTSFYTAVDAARIAWLEARQQWFQTCAYADYWKRTPIAEDEKLRALSVVLSQAKAVLRNTRVELHAALLSTSDLIDRSSSNRRDSSDPAAKNA